MELLISNSKINSNFNSASSLSNNSKDSGQSYSTSNQSSKKSSLSSEENSYSSVIIKGTIAERTTYAQSRVENLSKILQNTENSRFGQVAHLPYSNSPSAVAGNYGFNLPGSMPASPSFQTQSPSQSSTMSFVKSIGGALSGVTGSFMPSISSQVGSAIGSGISSMVRGDKNYNSSPINPTTIASSVTQATQALTNFLASSSNQLDSTLNLGNQSQDIRQTLAQSQLTSSISSAIESTRKKVSSIVESSSGSLSIFSSLTSGKEKSTEHLLVSDFNANKQETQSLISQIILRDDLTQEQHETDQTRIS